MMKGTINSAKKIECNSSKGYLYNTLKNKCNKFFSTNINTKQKKKHTHSNDTIQNETNDLIGYTRINLFKMNPDHLLMNFFKCFAIVIVILLNINVIKLLKNNKKL